MGISNLCASECEPKYTEWVYTLRCPTSFEIFYVGKTVNLKERLKQHIQEAKSTRGIRNEDKCTYINRMLLENKIPIMGLIDKTEIRTTLDKYHAFYKELFWIKFYLDIGWQLTNTRDRNSILDFTDYAYYKARRGQRSYDDYYYGLDYKGNKIYDIQGILNDGYKIPYIEEEEEIKEYNPWSNPRFISKNRLDKESYRGEWFTNIFREFEDEQINEY